MDLVIMAGGLGSRFGGNKQTEGVDQEGNFLLNYSIFDAIRTKFDKVVLIVKKDILELVKEKLSREIGDLIKIEYVVQSNDDVLALKKFGVERTKPLGTGHAILCVKDAVKDNFCIINADDFYGYNSFKNAHYFLSKIDSTSTNFGLVGFELEKTLSENGAVKRGVCQVDKGYITNIVESKIEPNGKVLKITSLESGENVPYKPNMTVSMNMFCLTPKVFDYLQKEFDDFCLSKENLESKEFLMPDILGKMIKQNRATMKLIPTDEKWIGMTFKEDMQLVRDSLQSLKQSGIYPQKLWEKQ